NVLFLFFNSITNLNFVSFNLTSGLKHMKAQNQANHETAYGILIGISFAHLLNDSIQSLIPTIYPLLKDEFTLSFSHIGFILLPFQFMFRILLPFLMVYTYNHS